MTTSQLFNIVSVKPADAPRRRGRPPFGARESDRRLAVLVAEARLIHRLPLKRVMASFRIDAKTVRAYVQAAPGYPEGGHLAKFVARSA